MKVLLADDHQIVLDALIRFIEEDPGYQVAGQARDGNELVRLAEEIKPDIAIVDVGLPGMNGIEATRLILKKNPDINVIALSMHEDLSSLSNMLKAGAKGYLSKSNASKELIRALKVVADGDYYLSPQLTTVMVDSFLAQLDTKDLAPAPELTPRESQVLAYIAQGLASKEIAHELDLSPKTVDTHRQKIMSKLGLNSVAGLVRYALRTGLAQP
jgi:DNA-binding NarL/FixJ family response regulator